jgi:uncharacterized ion transporter superfamily protein YfcC
MKRKENKNNNIKILFILFLLYAAISWVFVSANYQSGQLVEIGWYRVGLFDLVAVMLSSFTYQINDVIYLLFVGGMYGVLTRAESYKRIVKKVSNVVRENGEIAFLLVTFIVGLYTAMSSHIITLFLFVPFIITVFLKGGYDKLTAIAAGFGGLFLGYLGQVTGTYGNDFIYQYLEVTASANVIVKLVLFVVAYVLFSIFGISHLKNNKNDKDVEVDLYAVEEPKNIVKKSEQILTWPTVVMAVILLVITMIGYIPWVDAFGITFFDKVHQAVMNFSVAGVKIFETIIGITITAIGKWEDFLPVMFISSVLLLVVTITNRISFKDVCDSFGNGVKKMLNVAIMYSLAFGFFYLMYAYPWPTAVVDWFIKTDSYNLIFILLGIIAAVIATFLCADPVYSGYYYGQYIAAIYTVNLGITAIVWRLGSSLALLIAPTSYLLLAALTYADIPYKNWMKYIWKFALAFFVVAVIVLGIVIM